MRLKEEEVKGEGSGGGGGQEGCHEGRDAQPRPHTLPLAVVTSHSQQY